MMKSNKINQLAALTTGQELTDEPAESVLPENLFPPVPRRQVSNPTAPAPQLQSFGTTSRKPTDPAPQMPMLTQPVVPKRSINPVEGSGPDVPGINDTIKAMLVMSGLRAAWNLNHWRVYLPDAVNIVANIGGKNRRRWQTGVNATASDEEWMAEINRFWKDVHPGEPLPFGQV